MRFAWDERKAAADLAKHAVDFQEAVTVFGDPLAITITDPDHGFGEPSFLTMGLSSHPRLVVVSHSEINNEIRVISARVATKRERISYES
jgi:uncharacterized DUF497 family protein